MSETAIQKAQRVQKERREAGISTERLTPTQKLAKNTKSRKQMIIAKCWDCSNKQKQEITFCTVFSCPLWIARPYQKTKPTEEEVAKYMSYLEQKE